MSSGISQDTENVLGNDSAPDKYVDTYARLTLDRPRDFPGAAYFNAARLVSSFEILSRSFATRLDSVGGSVAKTSVFLSSFA